MPFLGKQPTSGFAAAVKQTLTPDGSTTIFTLTQHVASETSIEVFVGNVRQEPSVAYTTSGNKITFTAAPTAGTDVYIIFQGGLRESDTVPAAGTTVPGDFGVSGELHVSGQVGVGTPSNPDYDLDIKKITGGRDQIVRVGSEQGGGRTIMFADVHSSPTKYNFQIGAQSNVNNGFEITPSTTIGGTTFSNPALTVDENGYVKKPTQPMFEAVGNNATYVSIATHGNGNPVPFPTVRHNIGGHYDNSTYRFTAPVSGRYFFTSVVYTRTSESSNVEDIYTRFLLNGNSNRGYVYWYQTANAAHRHHSLTDHLFIELAANDYIELVIRGSATADFYNGPEESRFSGWLVG